MSEILKKIFAYIPYVLVAALLYWVINDKYTVPVMMYHNVADVDTFREDTVSPANFERHLQYLKKRGYNVLSVQELVDGINSGRKFPHNSVVITFDDGKKNNFSAFLRLKDYGYTAHFFISPGTVGNDDSLNWEDISRMHLGGMYFGSHGMVQAYLPEVSLKDQKYEIQESKKILEAKLGVPVDYFAYPIGGFSEEIKKLLRDSGYKGAFTTNRGTDRFDKDIFEINRIRFGDRDTSDFGIAVKLSGYYNLFRKLKKSH